MVTRSFGLARTSRSPTPRGANRGTSNTRSRGPGLLAVALLWVGLCGGFGALPLGAQENGGDDAVADSLRARVARADSIRATLEQPPGDREGLTIMDMVRAPFRLVGAGVAAVAIPVNWGVRQAGLIVRDPEAEDSEPRPAFDLDLTTLGSRSWPALRVRWHGLHPLFLEAAYSVRQYELYGAGLGFGREETAGLEAAVRYGVQRELHSWGVGVESAADDRSDYALTRLEAGVRGWTPVSDELQVELDVARERNDVDRGFDAGRPDLQDTFEPGEVPGAGTTTDFYRAGGALTVDLTSLRGPQLEGLWASGSYHVFQGTGGTDTDFDVARADIRAYLPVTPRHRVALRVLAEDRLREQGTAVPFTHMAELGDEDGLRGYRSRRFRDRSLLAGQAEWRYEVWWHPGDPLYRLEGFLFGDYGAVAPALGSLQREDFRFTPGFGLRLLHAGDGLGEIFYAFGGDEPRFDVSLGVTF